MLGHRRGQGTSPEVDCLSFGDQGGCGGPDPAGLGRRGSDRTASVCLLLDEDRAPIDPLQEPLALQVFQVAPDRRVTDLKDLAQLSEAHGGLSAYAVGNGSTAFSSEQPVPSLVRETQAMLRV
jgi:hypothetical protein